MRTRTSSGLLISVVFVVSTSAALLAAARGAAQEGGQGPRCAQVTASASWRGYGYTHVVTLNNQCERTVRCAVWTTVDPTPRHRLTARPGESSSVVTRGGSPGREVQARYECTEQ